jgi:cysteine synthase
MNELQPDILHCIGNSSLVALRNIVPASGARILLKLESENPTGSMKDRMALAMIEAAEAGVDGLVQSVGTAASLRGMGETLRRHNRRITVVAVEPSESPVLSGGRPGAHKIDGIGAGFVVPLWKSDIADRIEQVSTDEAVAMAFHLAREEGLFAGTSTGANVIAALRLADQLGPEATIVTVMCDTGRPLRGCAWGSCQSASPGK